MEKYGMPKMGKGVMGHEKKPKKCDPFKAQKSDMGKLNEKPMTNRGYPSEAMNYKY